MCWLLCYGTFSLAFSSIPPSYQLQAFRFLDIDRLLGTCMITRNVFVARSCSAENIFMRTPQKRHFSQSERHGWDCDLEASKIRHLCHSLLQTSCGYLGVYCAGRSCQTERICYLPCHLQTHSRR